VFYTFILSVRRWLKDNNNEVKTWQEINGKEMGTLELAPRIVKTSQVVNDIIEYHHCKRQSDDIKNSVEDNDEDKDSGICNESGEVNCGEEKKLPLFVEMTV
jgi:hypothetical protein